MKIWFWLPGSIAAILLGFLFPLQTEVNNLRLASIFSDHMVLQQGTRVRIFGSGNPGERIRVAIQGQEARTSADQNGEWEAWLGPLAMSRVPDQLRVTGESETLRVEDVLVGEVWLCSGQSNMEWEVRQSRDADIELLAAHRPMLRVFDVPRASATGPLRESSSTWGLGEPAHVGSFSAVGYAFGCDLLDVLDCPIGLIEADWSGSPISSWMREATLEKHPLLAARVRSWDQYQQDYLQQRPGGLANGMIATVAPYTIRGVLWYQGEADTDWYPDRYDERLRLLIEDWRDWWEIPDLPFGIVQLANFMSFSPEPRDDPWARVRDAQRRVAQTVPATGLIVTIDLGESNDIHARDKRTVGRRLARWALADVYGVIELRGGPEMLRSEPVEGAIEISFGQVGSGLHASGVHVGFVNQLGGFTIAGKDRIFHPARADLVSSDRVRVWSDAVPEPVAVRYGWQSNPLNANLSNRERLPASPFRTDEWPMASAPSPKP